MASSDVWHNEHLLDRIFSFVLCPTDLLRFRLVSRSWNTAVSGQIWAMQTAACFGRTVARLEQEPMISTSAVDNFKKLATMWECPAFNGWCEDHVTAHGQPYKMNILKVQHHGARMGASIIHQRTAEAETAWDYAEPAPRTRMKLVFNGCSKEVWAKDGLQAVATSRQAGHVLPLYTRRVQFVEYAKLPNSGPVDVPNNYFAFQVGPALLGCFMPPDAPLNLLHFKSHEQMLGLCMLWPTSIQARAANPQLLPDICKACPCANTQECVLHRSKIAATTSQDGNARTAAQSGGGQADARSNSEVSFRRLLMDTLQQLHGERLQPRGQSPAGPQAQQQPSCNDSTSRQEQQAGSDAGSAAPSCHWLRWQGLVAGTCFTGTILTNFQMVNIATGLRKGHAQLGAVQVWIQRVSQSPAQPSATRVEVLLHLPTREWDINAHGVPVLSEPHEEEAYAAPITCIAAVDILPNGSILPVALPLQSHIPVAPEQDCWAPRIEPCIDTPDSWLFIKHSMQPRFQQCSQSDKEFNSPTGGNNVEASTSVGVRSTADVIDNQTALVDNQITESQNGQTFAEPEATAILERDAFRAHMLLSCSRQINGMPHPSLVDRFPARLRGLAVGGVLVMMMVHPVVGRAVMCVSQGGLQALCPSWK